MTPVTFANIKTVIQFISVFISIFINALSIYLIVTKSPKIMGTYRHLMIYFCGCSMVFSVLDVIVQPSIETYKSAFLMVVDVKNRSLNSWSAVLFMNLLCGCIGVTVYGIAIHFIYRLLALERKGRLRYFNCQYLPIWFSIPILAGTIWYIVTENIFGMNPVNTEYIRNPVKDSFNMKMEDCVYGAAVFYPIDKNGIKTISWISFFGLGCYLTLLTIPFISILVAGAKSWNHVQKLLEHGESEFARNLQMQLYKALIAQTLIPVVFFFTPFGCVFVLPAFEIECQFMSAPITLVFAIYPAIDPLPNLFFVDYYRNPISNFLRKVWCRKPKVEAATINSTL